MLKDMNSHFMQKAIEEAMDGITNGHGGPFGSVIAKNGKIIATGHNMVIKETDSTAHSDIVTIRRAEKLLSTFDLSGCELYSTSEPCPMCLAACKLANISKVFYGCSLKESSEIGFNDEAIFNQIADFSERSNYLVQEDHDACVRLYDEYKKLCPKK